MIIFISSTVYPKACCRAEQRFVIRLVDISAARKIVQRDHVLVEPFRPRPLFDQIALDLVVVDDPALLDVDQENLARLQPPFLGDILRLDRQHADFAGHDDQIILGDVIPAGSQAVAIQHRADWCPLVKTMLAGPSHGSIRQA